MPKGALEADTATTSATQLRESLRQIEIKAGSIRRQNMDIEALLKERDALEDMLSAAEQEGLDVRPERGRAEAVDGLLRSHAGRIMRLLADKGGLKGARERNAPPEGHWWWYLDIYVHQRMKRAVTRWSIITVCIVIVLVVGNYILTKLYGPSPAERAFSDLTMQAERALSQGEVDQAISDYEQAVAIIDSDADAWAMLGVLYESQGRTADAQAAFAESEEHSESRVRFLFSQAQAYLVLGNADRAYDVALLAVETDSNSPLAYYMLGSTLEAKGDNASAAQAFDIAAELAYQQGQDVLYAMSRERQAVLVTGGR